jgi:putative protein kinase ArgK-like GTPase of G3E family
MEGCRGYGLTHLTFIDPTQSWKSTQSMTQVLGHKTRLTQLKRAHGGYKAPSSHRGSKQKVSPETPLENPQIFETK